MGYALEKPPLYLEDLNEQQQEAVLTTEGPLLILAGAGTGKTRVLTTRLIHILFSRLALPSQILAVTFTNKAAQEMKSRLQTMLNTSADGLWLGTFHSLSVRILRRFGHLIGLESPFTILDKDDQLRLLKQILQAELLDDKKTPVPFVASVISRWKDKALTPEKAQQQEPDQHTILHIYKIYQERLKTLNAVDFGDLLLHCLTLFQQHPDVLKVLQNQFHYLLVDEYQDTNVAQYLWLRLLVQGTYNLCCVGDDDQSIYAWRGAEIENILRFEKDFPKAKIIRLEQNYRSTQHILGTASYLIAHNEKRLGKTLWSCASSGEKVHIRSCYDGIEEARFVGEEIEKLQNHKLSSMAILVRASFQTREFEERFLTLGIPYKVIGGLRFFERLEIRDAIAYFRLIVHPFDSLAFERIINTPKRGIGPTTLKLLHEKSREYNLSLPQTASYLLEQNLLKGTSCLGVTLLLKDLQRWQRLHHGMDHVELAKQVLDESGYTHMWKEDKSPEAPGRLENLRELVRSLEDFASFTEFLEHVSLVTDTLQMSHEDMITIMTLHAAKGLEFDTVFLAGWEEGLFPHQKCLDENGLLGVEEERRLAYVGLTRARKKAFITYAMRRKGYQGWQYTLPSRFLKELPKEHCSYQEAPVFPVSTFSKTYKNDYMNTSYIDAECIDRDDINQDFDIIGKTVIHSLFGKGKIVKAENNQWHVRFNDGTVKKIMKGFLKVL
ncbi:MAG: UvrD-helicase domain-containing protein [Proteobacteria bacterium]|nr:UvrD-helicase domain-containing protein [Pseudomonadota bacterium]